MASGNAGGIRVVQRQMPSTLAKPTEAIFIRPTKGSITLTMHRMFNLLLAKAHEDGEAAHSYRVTIAGMARDLETGSNNTDFLKDTARRLASTIVEWDVVSRDGKRKWGVSSMLASAELEEGGLLEFSFSKHIKEKLFRPDMYAKLNLRMQNKFRSRHGLALYEQCVRYRNNPSKVTAVLPWSDWAAMLAASAGASQYVTEWKYFARDLLKPAIAEVNAIAEDFEVEALVTKEGRRVSTLQFKISAKRQASLDLEAKPHLMDPTLRLRIEKLGVPHARVRFVFLEYEEDAIRASLDYTERRSRSTHAPALTSPAAYFLDALKRKYVESQPKPSTLPFEGGDHQKLVASDFKQQFNLERARRAEEMFDEQSESERNASFESYVQSLGSSTLRARFVKYGPKGKTTKQSFFLWLAQKTWADPTESELLAFAVSLLKSSDQSVLSGRLDSVVHA